MNREERRGLSRLPPLMTDWEVFVSEDPSLEGDGAILVVVSTDPVEMRHTAVVRSNDEESIVDAVIAAIVEPTSGDEPGRPRTIRVVDPELSDLLSSKLKGAKIAFRVVDDLPAIEALTQEIEAELDELDRPGITVFLTEFRRVLDRLVAHDPWDLLSEHFVRFDSKTIDVAAPVLNTLIEQGGFRVFYDEDAAADFYDEEQEDVPAIELALLTEEDVGEPARWAEVGLVLDGGLYPSLSHVEDLAIAEIDGDNQYTVLVLLEALAGYLDTQRDALARGEEPTGSTVVPTGTHNIHVRIERIPEQPDQAD